VTRKPLHEGIVILGAPRSGTTLMRRLLNAHPSIACPGETYLLSSCARFLRSDRLADGTDMGVLSGLGFAGFDKDRVLSDLRDFAFSFPREFAHQQQKPRWAEKTAIDAFYLDKIERLCGDHAYFVCILRHGLDVACSCKELVETNGAIPLELHEFVKDNNKLLEAYCQAWVHATESILEFAGRHTENSIVCRYEDLVQDPETTLKTILEFIGENWDDGLPSRAFADNESVGIGDWKTYRESTVLTSSLDRWKSLPATIIQQLAPIANDTLQRSGYASIDGGYANFDDDDARRRYELGLLIQRTRQQ
jgi:hypothetical protein